MASQVDRSDSTRTLARGAQLLRGQTMSLERDEEYQNLLEQRDRLIATRLSMNLHIVFFQLSFSLSLFLLVCLFVCLWYAG